MRAAAARLATPRPDGFSLLLIAVAAFGAGLVLARNAVDGVSVQGDSIAYVTVARSLLAGDGFLQWGEGGVPFVAWAPGLPAALALVSLGVFDPLDVAGPFNAACFGLTILVAGHWMRQRLASRFLAAWCCLAIAASPLTTYTLAVWSEPLFVLLATLSLYGTDRFLETGRRSSLLLAAGAAALACATRYVGLSLLPAALPLLALRPGAAPRERAKDIAIFMLIAPLPLGLWLLRNLLAHDTLVGVRPRGTASFSDHLRSVADVVAGWLPSFPGVPGVPVAVALLAALGAVACLGFVRWLRGGGAATAPVAGAFAFSYVAAMVLGSTSIELTPLDDRYLSPAYVPLLVLAALAADRSLRLAGELRLPSAAGPRVRALWRRAAFAVLAAPLAFWAWQAAAAEARAAWDEVTGSASRSRTVRQLEESSGIRWLRAHPADGLVFSNRRELVYLFLGKDFASTRILPPALDTLLEEMRPSDRVVWFYGDFERPYEYDASDLRAALETEADTGTAAVFRFAAGSGEGPAATLEAEYASIAAREPEVRAHFDVYVVGRTLHWLREPCAPSDIEPKFVLHLVYADPGDLPLERRRSGFDNLDFLFRDRGVRFGERCMASIALPDRGITRVRVGQWLPAEGRNLWQTEFAFAE